MKKQCKIAIIDCGIDIETYKRFYYRTTFLVVKNGNVIELDKDYIQNNLSHGSLCLSYFEKSSQTVIDYYLMLENDVDKRCNVNDLVVALKWCLDSKILVISLSMGTTQHYDSSIFNTIMKRINETNTFLIASAKNDRQLTFPACLVI